MPSFQLMAMIEIVIVDLLMNVLVIIIMIMDHRRSQGGLKGPWPPLNFKSNYKTVSKNKIINFFAPLQVH